MNVFVAGGTGYIGNHVIERLVKDGYKVRSLVRKGSELKLNDKHIEFAYGDISDPASLSGALDGCDAVIYLIGIIREFPVKGITFELAHVEGVKRIYEKARLSGVKRWIQISANGVRPDTREGYIRTKYRAEEYLKVQDIDYTILRPSMVFGREAEDTMNFVNTVKDLLERFPLIVPVIGNGRYMLQPVHVDDLAQAVSMIINRQSTFNRTYTLCGAKSVSYNEIIDIVTRMYKLKKKMRMHIPAILIKSLAKLLQNVESFPVTAEQVEMLVYGNTCSDSDLFDELGIRPQGFY